MKNILITGKNSYVGTSFENWVKKYPDEYTVDTVDMMDESWRQKDFSKYDVVFHVAGIAHVSSDPKQEQLYYKVNRDLTIETAKKAKQDGVKQFIFMSSIIVYGNNETVIKTTTIPKPENFYGNSKLEAENGIKALESDTFKVVILRPPMIYGKDSKGNFPKLVKLAKITPIFPIIDNQRSMLYIDNLCEFIRLMVVYNETGIFFPQNDEYVNPTELVRLIAEIYGKKIWFTKLFNPIIKMMGKLSVVNKVFGSLVYDKNMSFYNNNVYETVNFKSSIELTQL